MTAEITPDYIKKNGNREHFHKRPFAEACRSVQMDAKCICTDVEVEGDIYVFYWIAE